MEQHSIKHHLKQIYQIISDRIPHTYKEISQTQRALVASIVIIVILFAININLLIDKHEDRFERRFRSNYMNPYMRWYDDTSIEDIVEESQKRHQKIEREFNKLQQGYHHSQGNKQTSSYKSIISIDGQRKEIYMTQQNGYIQGSAIIQGSGKQEFITKLNRQKVSINESGDTLYFSGQFDPQIIIEAQ